MNKIEVNEELYNMLMIGMFYKISPSIDELIDRAYRDMAAHTLQGIPDKDKKQALRDKGKETIENRIKTLENETCSQEAYDTWHFETCKELIDIYDKYYKDIKYKYNEKTVGFSFGQAQKWVNMTMKYLCMVKPDEYEWIEKDWKCYLHFPMDNYILNDYMYKKEKLYFKKSSDVTPWSKMDDDSYYDILEAVRNECDKLGVSVYEWENKAWNDIADKK